MNHPFPALLPLLRRIYAGRFTAVRFLIPFERIDAPDVITVYRGSYVHAAYLTDARAELMALDCDYYLVIHDDVLLNPRISEATFRETFPLGPDEGFIPVVTGAPHDMGSWVWHYGMIARLLFPKSILFGSGVDPATLERHLPAPDRVQAAMEAVEVWPALGVRLDENAYAGLDVQDTASRLLLHGYAEPLRADEAQRAVEERSLRIERDLIATMAQALRARPRDPLAQDANLVPLPLPLASAGFATDFYILPRSGLADFCHYMGVAAAANLFVEIIAPTLLFACCARVQQARNFGLDCSGLSQSRRPDWFLRHDALAIHPFKLSAIGTGDTQDAFVEMLEAIGRARVPDPDVAIRAGFGLSLDSIAREGWTPSEDWGIWSTIEDATLEVALDAPTTLRLLLYCPIRPQLPTVTGRITYNGGASVHTFSPVWPDAGFWVELDVHPDPDGIARLTVHTDEFVVPADYGAPDTRRLGTGIQGAEWDGRIATGAPQTVPTGR